MELLDPTDAPTPATEEQEISAILCALDQTAKGSYGMFSRDAGSAADMIRRLRADAAASRAPSEELRIKAEKWLQSSPEIQYLGGGQEAVLDAQHHNEAYDLIQELLTALAAGARAVPSEQEEMDRLRIEVETTKTLLAAWQKRAMEAERINPHGRMLTPEELEPFITEMRERTIPAIVKAVHQRQKDAAAMRHIPLSACAVPETQEAPKSLLRPAYRPSENTESNDGERLSAQIGRVKAALLREDSQQARTLFDAASGLCIAASAIKKYLPFTDAARSAVPVQDAPPADT